MSFLKERSHEVGPSFTHLKFSSMQNNLKKHSKLLYFTIIKVNWSFCICRGLPLSFITVNCIKLQLYLSYLTALRRELFMFCNKNLTKSQAYRCSKAKYKDQRTFPAFVLSLFWNLSHETGRVLPHTPYGSFSRPDSQRWKKHCHMAEEPKLWAPSVSWYI